MFTTDTRPLQRGSLAALAVLVLANGAATASAAPATTTYRIVPLTTSTPNLVYINAKDQVAFTEGSSGNPRGIFYDGKTLRDIGTLGGPTNFVAKLNDAGQVTGVSSTRKGINHAYRWSRATGIVDLAAPGTLSSFGTDINSQGWVAGIAEFSPGVLTAFRWTPQTGMVNLGALDTISYGAALNNAGTVVGAAPLAGTSDQHAVRWPGTTPIAITPSPATFAAAYDINNAGQIVGSGGEVPPTPGIAPSFAGRAFLWSARTGIIDLGVPGPTEARAEKINEKGLVIGSRWSLGSTSAFIWSRETGPILIGDFGGPFGFTADLNNRGQVVGTYADRAFVWTRAEGLVDLNSRLANAPPDFFLRAAVAISDRGTIVATANTGTVLLVPSAAYQQPPVAGPVKLSGTPRVGALLSFSAAFTDADLRDTHTAEWSWGDGGKTVGTVSEKNGAGGVSGQHAYRKAGIYTVRLTVTDSGGKRSTVQRNVVVCASGAAIVAGEGSFISPPNALVREPRAGIAQFAFLSEADGKVAVQFEVAGMVFRGSGINSVTLGDARLRFSGAGTLNGSDGYRYTLTASDGAHAQDGKSRFGIRISHLDPVTKQEVVDYDNQPAGREGSAVSEGMMLIGAR